MTVSPTARNRFFSALDHEHVAAEWQGARHGTTLDLLLQLDSAEPGRLVRACSAAALSEAEALGVAAVVGRWGAEASRQQAKQAASLGAVLIADAVAVGAVYPILHVMAADGGLAAVQQAGCDGLRRVAAAGGDDGRRRLVEAGVIESVLRAMGPRLPLPPAPHQRRRARRRAAAACVVATV